MYRLKLFSHSVFKYAFILLVIHIHTFVIFFGVCHSGSFAIVFDSVNTIAHVFYPSFCQVEVFCEPFKFDCRGLTVQNMSRELL